VVFEEGNLEVYKETTVKALQHVLFEDKYLADWHAQRALKPLGQANEETRL
jgi:hypothetical protein